MYGPLPQGTGVWGPTTGANGLGIRGHRSPEEETGRRALPTPTSLPPHSPCTLVSFFLLLRYLPPLLPFPTVPVERVSLGVSGCPVFPLRSDWGGLSGSQTWTDRETAGSSGGLSGSVGASPTSVQTLSYFCLLPSSPPLRSPPPSGCPGDGKGSRLPPRRAGHRPPLPAHCPPTRQPMAAGGVEVPGIRG